MNTRYCCPNCQTNRSRFNVIKQVARAVKLNPQTGDVMESMIDPGPLHIAYNGPEKRVQCAVCGLIDDERLFIKFGEK